MKTKRSKLTIVKLLIAVAIATGFLPGQELRLASQTSPLPSEPINTQLDGSIVPCGESPVGFCAVGSVSSGLLKGSKEATYLAVGPSAGLPGVEPPSTISYSANQVFHTDKGDLQMSVVGVSDYASLVFTEVARITGGTGRFANATGNLFISGTFASDGVRFQSRVTGEICLDRATP